MIGDSIKKLRNEKKISQRALARASGVSFAYIQQLEKGLKKNPSIDILNKISDAFVISLDELLNDETTSFSSKLITAILRMDYLSYITDPVFIDSEGYNKDVFEAISEHTGISVDSLKKCIEENIDLKANEQVELIDYWDRWKNLNDGVDFEGFLYDNYKEIMKNLRMSKKIKKILNKYLEKNNLGEPNVYDPSIYSDEDQAMRHLKALVWFVTGKENILQDEYDQIFDQVANIIKYEIFKIENNDTKDK